MHNLTKSMIKINIYLLIYLCFVHIWNFSGLNFWIEAGLYNFYYLYDNHHQGVRAVRCRLCQLQFHPPPSIWYCWTLKVSRTVERNLRSHQRHLKAKHLDLLKLPQRQHPKIRTQIANLTKKSRVFKAKCNQFQFIR